MGQIPNSDMKALWGRSGNRCAFCRTLLSENDNNNNFYLIGEMAHIEGENQGSARFNYTVLESERNRYENIIALCPNCHTRIDKNPADFPVDLLKKTKSDHERWVSNTLQSHMIQINFAELNIICKYLIKTPINDDESKTVLAPKEKIDKNNLSIQVENLILIGMMRFNLVKDYLNRNPDIEFSDRLRAGFVKKYHELVANGFERDELFDELFNFAALNSVDFNIRAAGLAVLTYFFEICEVFEK
jgi:hypothetical protein